jgi:choline dehydrogenase-like flavoprotein
MIEGFKHMRRILQAPALAGYKGKEFMSVEAKTDGQIEDFIRNHADTIYHPVGSCKMGAANDSMAVVGSDLKVRGVAGLRVVDASIMPSIVSGNTNAPTMMIAQVAAGLIAG